MKKEEILEQLKTGVINGDEELTAKAASEAIAAGINASEAINNGLVAGMNIVAELYQKEEYYVPEVIVASDALYAGLDILKAHIITEDSKAKGVALIGVTQGDVHDIGKNLVKLMLEVAGFEVHDLGRDVNIERFTEEAIKVNADIVCISALMTTTMIGIKDILAQLRSNAPGKRVLIGGAPLSQQIADSWGADGYGKNAAEAVKVAKELIA